MALGRRVKAIEDGKLGPVLKRWINASIEPTAELLRDVAGLYLEGHLDECAVRLDSPLFGMAQWASGDAQPLKPFLQWCLRGESKGREANDHTYADDLVLTGLAVAISKIAATRHTSDGTKAQGFTVNSVLDAMAQALMETVTGQFIVSVQGAKAMQMVRKKNSQAWRQGRSLKRIVGVMRSQMRSQLLAQEDARAEDLDAGTAGDKIEIDGKRILTIQQTDGDLRHIEFKRTPDDLDWEMLCLSWTGEDKFVRDRNKPMWLAFAMLILCAAQRVGGWFDITTRAHQDPTMSAIADRGSKRHRSKTKILVLSEDATQQIKVDVEKWVASGFYCEPMVCPPGEDGDYLTMKHRPIQGRLGPKGMLSEQSTITKQAAAVLSNSPWQVNGAMLAWCRDNEQLVTKAMTDQMGELPAKLCLAAFRKDAAEDKLYLPTALDFRGRFYYRPSWVNPQQGSINKALLQFPPLGTRGMPRGGEGALMMHCSNLKGMNAQSIAARLSWFLRWKDAKCPYQESADEPLMLHAAGLLINEGREDAVPCQIDGTCNGLQHLSALFRDQIGGANVNLCYADIERDTKRDIYQDVAYRMTDAFEKLAGPFPMRSMIPWWVRRFIGASVVFTRRTAKRPVMVLPFGGSKQAVLQALKASILEQPLDPDIWLKCDYEDARDGHYSAFKDRQLATHPLFNKDCQHLAEMTWNCITTSIPKAMQAMKVFQAIGSKIGEYGLSWQTPSGMWVTQAKSIADRRQVSMRGFHLPDAVRRLTLLCDRDEVDPKYHKQGIVANYIHSLDASHLACTLYDWSKLAWRDKPVGAIHDCVMTRASCMPEMHKLLRENFSLMYEADPLKMPVELEDGNGGGGSFDSWYDLAGYYGLAFPGAGEWRPEEVKSSPYFFS